MPKNVIVCCDGTANEFAQDRTNVLKLFYTLVQDPLRQAVFYHPGIGTMEAMGALTSSSKWITKTLGQAMGYGLETDIRDAYTFVMKHFEEGDRLFLFGFSRGAFTARAVASLLKMYGLILKGNEPLVPYAIRMLTAINRLRGSPNSPEIRSIFDIANGFREHFCRIKCQPHFVGVWDTVSSVGWIENPIRFPYSDNNGDIEIGRHAIAIDERRAFFRSNLWHPKSPDGGPRNVKQVWFPGVHCDVGGGYPEAESGLSKIPLQWMLTEAKAAGLLVDNSREDLVLGRSGRGYAPPDPHGKMHESLTWKWWIPEFVSKRHYNWAKHSDEHRMNLFRRRTIPQGSLVHESAYLRGDDYVRRAFLPNNAVRVS